MEHNIYPCALQQRHQLLLPLRQSHQAMKLFQSQILPNSYLPLPIFPSLPLLPYSRITSNPFPFIHAHSDINDIGIIRFFSGHCE